MAAWLEVDPATDVVRWQAAARARGVAFAAGREFALAPRDVAALRVGFGAATERELEAGVRVMAATARRRDA
jgi:DNA-binding transcriptional MocR family regulator